MLPRAAGARCALRRPLFRRRIFDAHLLPAHLHGEAAEARELPFLPQRRGGGIGRLPAMPAMPSGACAGQCERGCDDASGASGGEHDGRPDTGQDGARCDRRAPRCHGPASAACLSRGIRRRAGGIRSDAAFAACQAAVDRYATTDRGGGVRQWFRQRPALQCPVQAALPFPAESIARRDAPARCGRRYIVF